jgi:hypothetical protein
MLVLKRYTARVFAEEARIIGVSFFSYFFGGHNKLALVLL